MNTTARTHSPLVRHLAITTAALPIVLACSSGGVEGQPQTMSSGPDAPTTELPEPGPDVPGAACGSEPVAGPSPMRRLTRREYNNTVRDLLGDATQPASNFVPEERALGFDNNADALGVTGLLAEQYEEAANSLAAQATQDVAALLGCDPVAAGAPCVHAFIPVFGAAAFRRPLTQEEVTRYSTLYAEHNNVGLGVRAIVQAMLQSPHFLYRVEFGQSPTLGTVPVAPYELASRLSYLFWNTMPDADLFAAAANGTLSTPAEVEAQARRLLVDPRARDMVSHFHGQWLELDQAISMEKDTELFPTFTPSLRDLFVAETEHYATHVVFDGDARLSSLLTANFSFMNQELATFYGVVGPQTEAFERVELDPTRRAGFLTQASILATHAGPQQASPVSRGIFIREKLLCAPPPPPPPGLNVQPPDYDPSLTTRERFEQHRTEPTCAGCHFLIDPVGLGFGHYDSVGLWQDEEAGRPIDATGDLASTDVEGPFNGAIELATRLSQSEQVSDCMVSQWFRFGYGRAETAVDECSLGDLQNVMSTTQGDIRELLVALTQTDAFLYRTNEE